jgi:hypothetical protein
MPLSDRLTAGLGFGAPFAISGLWNDDGGIHRFNMLDQSLFVIDLSPTVAYRLTGNLSVGLALNVVAFKELRTKSLFGPAWAGAPGAAITLQSDEDFWLPVPPFGFDPSFDEVSVTLGANIESQTGCGSGSSIVWRPRLNSRTSCRPTSPGRNLRTGTVSRCICLLGRIDGPVVDTGNPRLMA